MSKLPCFTKPKNRDGYYFTPTVDGKTKWAQLGTGKQAALEKYHLDFLVFLLMVPSCRFNVRRQSTHWWLATALAPHAPTTNHRQLKIRKVSTLPKEVSMGIDLI